MSEPIVTVRLVGSDRDLPIWAFLAGMRIVATEYDHDSRCMRIDVDNGVGGWAHEQCADTAERPHPASRLCRTCDTWTVPGYNICRCDPDASRRKSYARGVIVNLGELLNEAGPDDPNWLTVAREAERLHEAAAKLASEAVDTRCGGPFGA